MGCGIVMGRSNILGVTRGPFSHICRSTHTPAFCARRNRRSRLDCVFQGLRERAIQDALQRDCTIQSGGGNMASFGNPSALSFFPVTAAEEPRRLQAWSVDVVETARVDRDPVGLRARHVKRVRIPQCEQKVCWATPVPKV